MKAHGNNKECLIFSTKPFNDTGYFDKLLSMFHNMNLPTTGWVTDFLPEAELVKGLSDCDLIFLPYSEYGGLGISAAIRTCIKAGVPIVSFENSFFKDCVHDSGLVRFIGDDPYNFDDWSTNLNEITQQFKNPFSRKGIRVDYEKRRDDFINRYNWGEVAGMYLDHFAELVNGREH